MKTRKKLLFPALFLLALLLTLMLTMFELMHSPSGWSIEENRALASAPQVSARSVWDGTLAQDAEAFYKDHIAARRLLLKLDTAIQMQVLRARRSTTLWWETRSCCPRRAFPRG